MTKTSPIITTRPITNKATETSPVHEESIRKYIEREVFKVSKNRRGCNISKQPSNSRLDTYKKCTPSSPSGPDTISTISPIMKISKYLIEKPQMVSNFKDIQARNSKVERCKTMDDTKRRAGKLEKYEKLNVTPASGLKKPIRVQYTDVQKRKLFRQFKEKSFINHLDLSNISAPKKKQPGNAS